jgi:hypothetical protein
MNTADNPEAAQAAPGFTPQWARCHEMEIRLISLADDAAYLGRHIDDPRSICGHVREVRAW